MLFKSVREFRQNLKSAFDAVERGEPVVIRRKNIQFTLASSHTHHFIPQEKTKTYPWPELPNASLVITTRAWCPGCGEVKEYTVE